jgi:hypothetical protein
MNWRINGDVKIEMENVDQARLVIVTFSMEAIAQLCLGLSMLWHRLVESLSLQGSGITLVFGQCGSDGDARALVTWKARGATLKLSSTELEYWLCFFLRGVRDGMAEVDHIDVEADPSSGSELPGFFVLKVPNAAPPVSAEEARRRLGLE